MNEVKSDPMTVGDATQPGRPVRWRVRFAVMWWGLVAVVLLGFHSIPVSSTNIGSNGDFQIQVVLGGNARERSEVSYALWCRHRTPILVTGDEGRILCELLRLGVPASEILHESEARTTWENAELSIPLLRQHGVSSVVIVTSWFHTARALGCFETQAPDISFCTESDPQPCHWGREERKGVIRERFKSIGYGLVHRLNPWRSVH